MSVLVFVGLKYFVTVRYTWDTWSVVCRESDSSSSQNKGHQSHDHKEPRVFAARSWTVIIEVPLFIQLSILQCKQMISSQERADLMTY